MRADLHAHTCFSMDAITKPETFVKFAKRAGLGAVAVTDHNTTGAWEKTIEAGKKEGIMVIPAEEIMCWESGKKIGEVIGLFLQEWVKSGPVGEVLDRLKEQGALIIAPHPFDSTRHGLDERLEPVKNRLHAIEVLNSHTITDEPNKRAREFAGKNNLACTAGSDAHTPWEIGRAWVEFEGSTAEDLRKAILGRKTVVGGKREHIFYRPFIWLRKMKMMPTI